jgi:hypothetical protein
MKTATFILILTFLVECGSSSSLQTDETKIFDSTVIPITDGICYKPDT